MSRSATSPICDQGGECDLQDQAMVYGSDRGRFYEYKRSVQDKNAGPLIKTIMTRCIHCTRCIRYATEIAGIEVYGTTGRGKNMQVGTYISSLFNSEISGNVIDLCPVGALTSKPYAFTVRPWELKSIESIDILDAFGTNICIDIRGSQVMRILPKANKKLNQQWISDKTRFAHDGLKCQRLYFPLLLAESTKKLTRQEKKNLKFQTVSWEKAIETIVQEIEKTQAEKVGGIIGNFIDLEAALSFKQVLNQIGVSNIYVEQTNALISPIKEKLITNYDFRTNYLSNFKLSSLEQENHDLILLIGTNPRYEASMLNVRLRQWIIKQKMKKNHLASGFADLPQVVALGTPLNLTYKTNQVGNNLEQMYWLAQGKSGLTKKFLKAKKPLSIIAYNIAERIDGQGIKKMLDQVFTYYEKICRPTYNQEKKMVGQANSLEANPNNRKFLQHTLFQKNAIKQRAVETNNLDNTTTENPLSSFYKKKKQANSCINVPPGGENADKARKNQYEFATVLHTNASIPGLLDIGCLSYYPKEKKELEFIYSMGADCKKNVYNENAFIVYQGHHGCYTAKIANVILPSTTFMEKKGTYVNTFGLIQQTERVKNPEGDVRHDWEILQKIANATKIPGIFTKNIEISFTQKENILEGTKNHIQSTLAKTRDQSKETTSTENGQANASIRKQNVRPVSANSGIWKKSEKNVSIKTKGQTQKILDSLLFRKQVFQMESKSQSIKNVEKMNILGAQSKNIEKTDMIANFKDTLECLAPFLIRNKNNIDNSKETIKPLETKKQFYKIYKSLIVYDRDNFYLSDIITKASITMGKCSTSSLYTSKIHNFFYNANT